MASITKRGNSYRITVSNGQHPDGRQIVETVTWHPDPDKTDKQNQKALKAFAMHFEERVKAGRYMSGEKITFQDFTYTWFRDYADKQLQQVTLAAYRDMLENHILPEIGNLKLSRIQPQHLNKLYDKLLSERKDGKEGGYSAATVKRAHNIISAIFAQAVRWNVVEDTPTRRVQPPRDAAAAEKVKYFTLDQAKLFLGLLGSRYEYKCVSHDRTAATGKQYHVDEYASGRDVPLQLQLFLQLALFTGCRRGELIALEWTDIDYQERELNITKSTTLANGKMITKTPKTRSSVRRVTVPASVLDLARQWHQQQLQYRLSIGDKWEGANYVFTTWNGLQMRPETPYKTFKKIIEHYNKTAPKDQQLPDIPLHGLRHTSATLLISEKVDVKTVSEMLGHAKASTTIDIYAHALQEATREASDKLDNLLKSS